MTDIGIDYSGIKFLRKIYLVYGKYGWRDFDLNDELCEEFIDINQQTNINLWSYGLFKLGYLTKNSVDAEFTDKFIQDIIK